MPSLPITLLHSWLFRRCIALLLLACSTSAVAADPCTALRAQSWSPDPATRVAAVACQEHFAWYRPFIDAQGRLASTALSEADSSPLADGTTAWQRVASYWRDSGLLGQMSGYSGASDCGYGAVSGYSATMCRAFVVDHPWSAAFISYVLRKATLPGFNASASHVDYVRDAYRSPDLGAYQLLDPFGTSPAAGDMLCSVRGNGRVLGPDGLRAALGNGGGLPMHCDVFVGVSNGIAYLVGGNVQQAVTMRLLPVNRSGQLWSLPRRSDTEVECSPDTVSACNFNRQDWVALLRLRPADALARLPPAPPFYASRSAPPPAQCCVNCVVGSGVPRCPRPPAAESTPAGAVPPREPAQVPPTP